MRAQSTVLFVVLAAVSAAGCGGGATLTTGLAGHGGNASGGSPGQGGVGGISIPVDACTATPSPCSVNATCTVNAGGFTCACKAGFAGDGFTCADIDECATLNGGCDANAICTNRPGGSACACRTGFFGDGISCSDVDECGTANGGCDFRAICTNARGGRSCACPAGFSGDGLTCVDIDECATANGGCDPHAVCTNTIGGRTCSCDRGFTTNGASCDDDDECASANGGCNSNALCTNTSGGHVCTCNSGFWGDGLICGEIDECIINHGGCDPLATCTNTPGAFTCGNCPVGYTGGGVSGCQDINECTGGTANCAINATCANNAGGFACTCMPGFTGNGVVCNACGKCTAGQYQTAGCTATVDTACHACPTGCATCSHATTCNACAPGYHLVGNACVACSTCSGNQFQVSACTPTQDTACSTCSACAGDHYRTALCAGSSDTSCDSCSVCGPGQYQTAACGATNDATCTNCDANCTACTGAGACTSCGPGHFLSNGVCVACGSCGSGQFLAAACTATHGTICSTCASCGSGTYQTAACTAIADTTCTTCSPACSGGTHQTGACGGTDDRVCSACATCAAGTFETVACTSNTDRSCTSCATCGNNQYETTACTATTNRTCATCTTCGPGKYQATACGVTSDTVCPACDAHCDACTGPGACTTCLSGYELHAGLCASRGKSCLAIHVADATAPSGVYQLDPDGGSAANAFFAYCDMTTDGGGWMKILQYHDAPYTPTAAAIGDIAVAGTAAIAKLADANINGLGALAADHEYRFQGDFTAKKLFIKSSAIWDDTARGEGLVLTGTTLACEATTNCAYETVTAPSGRPSIDSNDWSPSSAGGLNDQDRYFTDYDNTPSCFAISTTERCYNSGASTGHALIPNLSVWMREVPVPGGNIIVYPLDENGGVTAGDTSGNALNATYLMGGWTQGHTGSALLGAVRTDAAVPATDAVTVSLWVQRDGAGSGYARILSWNGDGLELADAATSNNLAVYAPSIGWRATGISFGSGFHHLAVTAGGGTIVVYYDGAPVFTTPGVVNLSGQMWLGIRCVGGEPWNGPIDQVRVYDRVLTSAEIAALAQE